MIRMASGNKWWLNRGRRSSLGQGSFFKKGVLKRASLVAQRVKCLPAMQETWVRSLGQEDPLEKEMASHSSLLGWRIPWTEEPGGLQSMGSQRVRHDWATELNWTCHPYLESVDPTPRDEVTHFITKEGLDPLSIISSALLLILCSNRTAIILFSKWRMPGTRTSNNLPMLNSLDSKPKIGFKTQMSWLQILHTTLSSSTTTQHSNVKSNPLKSESPLKSNTIPEESMQEVQFGKWNQSVWIEVYFSLYSQNLFDNFNCMLIHKMIRKWAGSWFFNSNFSDKIVWSNEMKSFTLHLTFISWLGGR